jgi:hypothetical protein
MAKFNTYGYEAHDDDGGTVTEGRVDALSRESAWMKAVAAMFDAIEPGTGLVPVDLHVWRIPSASEHHG